jgi:hypothetical protein
VTLEIINFELVRFNLLTFGCCFEFEIVNFKTKNPTQYENCVGFEVLNQLINATFKFDYYKHFFKTERGVFSTLCFEVKVIFGASNRQKRSFMTLNLFHSLA